MWQVLVIQIFSMIPANSRVSEHTCIHIHSCKTAKQNSPVSKNLKYLIGTETCFHYIQQSIESQPNKLETNHSCTCTFCKIKPCHKFI